MRPLIATTIASLISAAPAVAWDGTDTSTGNAVAIERGNLVREGREVEVYDYEAGEYRNVTVEDINQSGSSVEVEVYDSESGEYRTFEMEDE